MLNRLSDYIQQQHLFPSGSEVLLAVSGGRDSVCMAHLVHRLGVPFAIAHCNFHLRPGDSDRDQAFVRSLADQLGVPFHTADFDTRPFAAARSMSIEEAARHLRYSWFASLCAEHGYACLATAHHRDDSVETFFLNLFRGAGLSGLHGILPSREVAEWPCDNASTLNSHLSALTIVRPMLCFSRAEIDAYVEANQLDYVDDYTNGELDAMRNRIRLQLMPLLRQLYPSVDSTMASNLSHLRDADLLLQAGLASLRSSLLRPVRPAVPSASLHILAAGLHALHSALDAFRQNPSTQRTLLFELLRPYGFNAAQAADILAALASPRTGACWHSPTHLAVLDRDRLLLAPEAAPVPPHIESQPVRAVDTSLPGIGRTDVFVDADLLPACTLRPWQPADRFCPFGMHGRQRLVSDVLKDAKLSIPEKKHLFVLCAPDGRIVWLVGIRADERFRVGPKTKNILKLSVIGNY